MICPHCRSEKTRMLYRLFESEQWLCEDCLNQWSIRFPFFEMIHRNIPRRAQNLDKKDLKRIENKLLALDYYEEENRVYWTSFSGSILYLDSEAYWEKHHRLEKYFQDRTPAEQRSLIEENMSIGAKRIEEDIDLSQIKVEETFSDFGGNVMCWKISNYPEELDGKDLTPLVKSRKNGVSSLRENDDWRTERNDWVYDLAEAEKNKLRKELVGTEENIEPKQKRKGWRRSIWA